MQQGVPRPQNDYESESEDDDNSKVEDKAPLQIDQKKQASDRDSYYT